MKHTALILLAVLAAPSPAFADGSGIPWEGSTRNCDGSLIDGKVTYALYVNANRPDVAEESTTSDPCTADTGDDEFWGDGTLVEADADLCRHIDSGDWYISMTATTVEGERSNYARPVKVQIERDDDNDITICRVVEPSI